MTLPRVPGEVIDVRRVCPHDYRGGCMYIAYLDQMHPSVLLELRSARPGDSRDLAPRDVGRWHCSVARRCPLGLDRGFRVCGRWRA